MNNKNYTLTIILFITIILILPTITIAASNQNTLRHFNSNTKTISFNDNTPPNPPIISGPSSGKIGINYDYTFTLTDNDDDFLTILEVDFGNEIEGVIKKNCEKPWENGTIIAMTHKWTETGEYSITARVMDSNGAWSNWSEPLQVSMPKTKSHFPIIEKYYHLITTFITNYLY